MKVDGKQTRAIWLEADGWSVGIIDQTLLPHRFVTARLKTLDDAVREEVALVLDLLDFFGLVPDRALGGDHVFEHLGAVIQLVGHREKIVVELLFPRNESPRHASPPVAREFRAKTWEFYQIRSEGQLKLKAEFSIGEALPCHETSAGRRQSGASAGRQSVEAGVVVDLADVSLHLEIVRAPVIANDAPPLADRCIVHRGIAFDLGESDADFHPPRDGHVPDLRVKTD